MTTQKSKFQKLAPKIIVPVIIVIAIGAIFFLKARQQSNDNTGSITDNNGVSDSTTTDFDLHVKNDLDLDELKSYGLPIMIDFGANYCAPCREMKPILEKLNTSLKGKAIIKYVDVEKLPEVAQDFPIRVIPTQVFYDKDGNPYEPSNPDAQGMYKYSSKDTNEHLITVHEGLMTEANVISVLMEMGLEE